MKKYFLYFSIIISTILALPVYAEVVVNSGFIPSQIWYSKTTLVEGDTVNIHTAVWNGEKDFLSIKVEFYDKNVILGSRDVTLSSLELKDVYVPWKVTAGDHIISAKIISSLATVSGKKEKISLDRISTSQDKQFVSVIVKDKNGTPISTNTDTLLQDQINKTTNDINKIIPEKVSAPVSSGISSVDSFRDKTLTEVTSIKNETQKEIDQIKIADDNRTSAQTLNEKSNIQDATRRPIAYIKLFLFTILTFIFSNKIIFYSLLILIIFYIIRSIYRTIKNK
jgi:hypothetical protein